MKKFMVLTVVLILGMAFGPMTVVSSEQQMGPPITHSKDFERMKDLVGVWEGKADMGKGMETLKVTYELTSAGNAIVEKFAAGQPHDGHNLSRFRREARHDPLLLPREPAAHGAQKPRREHDDVRAF